MVLEIVLPGLVLFTFIMVSAYAGALRALDVYFDPDKDSVFLSDDSEPPGLQ